MRTEEGLILLNDRGKILWSNSVAAELLGFSRDELCQLSLPLVGTQSIPSETALTQRIRLTPPLVGKGALESPLAATPSVGPVAAAFRAILAGELTEAEGAARIPDKDERRIAVHWRLWSMPGGKDRQILFSISETAQASAEGPITSSYRDIFEHAVEGIYRATIEGQFLEVNPALARMCGYESPAEMIDCVRDLNSQYYVRPNRRAEFIMAIRQHGSVAGFESETFRADGSVFWSAEFARVVANQDGSPLYVEGSVIDVSKRKQAETALRLSEEKFRSLVETTRVIPFEFHPASQTFVYIGPQAEAVFRCSCSPRLTLDRWVSLIHPDDFREGTRFALPTTEEPFMDYQTEFRICTSDADEIWIKQIVHFDYSDEEFGPVVRGFFFEITEAKKLEAERESSRVQLRELASRLEQVREEERMSIAGEIHDEVGQALTLLKIDLSWMMSRLAIPVTEDLRVMVQERIRSMEQKIEGAFQTVRGILLALRPPLLEELGLEEAIEFHLAELAKRVGFRYDWDVTPVAVVSISTKIAVFRIFQEILTNVARHAKASRVKVQLHELGDDLFLKVEDNGCGIAQEKLANPKSFGILGIKERALAMGGKVELSGAPGKGTTVTLRIPLERAALLQDTPAAVPAMQLS
jgi:PAS domain S-box-containing protein